MTEPTIDERIENMRKEGQTFSATGHRGRALAIIDELKAEIARLKGAMLKGGQHVNEPGVGPMARLKQENRDLEAENARLKDKLSYWQDPNWTSPGVEHD